MTSPQKAFRAAVADGRECTCEAGICEYPCSLCTADFIQMYPCPADSRSLYYVSRQTPVLLPNNKPTVLTDLVIQHGQCECEVSKCLNEGCKVCSAGRFRCPRGRHVPLNAYEKSAQKGFASGELPCPYGESGGSCTLADGHFYHGDCVPHDTKLEPELSAFALSLLDKGVSATELAGKTKQYREGLTFVCQQHDRHPHDGRVCARCPACLALDPNAINAAHDMSKWIGSDAEVALARHLDRLAEALGIVGAEDDIDMYEAVEGLHKEVDRMREVFGHAAYLLQKALNPNASSAAFASPAEQPWKGAKDALDLVQKEVSRAAGKG